MKFKILILCALLGFSFNTSYSMYGDATPPPWEQLNNAAHREQVNDWFREFNPTQMVDSNKIIYLETHIFATEMPKPKQLGFSDDEQMFAYFHQGVSTLKIFETATYALLSLLENCPENFSIDILKTTRFTISSDFNFPEAHTLLILSTQRPTMRMPSRTGAFLAVYYPEKKGSTIGSIGICKRVDDPEKRQLILYLNQYITNPENQDNTQSILALFEKIPAFLKIWRKLTATEIVCLGSYYNFDIRAIKTNPYWWCTAL